MKFYNEMILIMGSGNKRIFDIFMILLIFYLILFCNGWDKDI